MPDASIAQRKPDHGVDAPGVIRNLGLAAGIGLGVWGSALAHLWSGLVPLGRDAFLDARGMGLGIGATATAMAIWMLWSSKIGKISSREALLDRVMWTGSERDERGQAIAEICRVLAPGGHALFAHLVRPALDRRTIAPCSLRAAPDGSACARRRGSRIAQAASCAARGFDSGYFATSSPVSNFHAVWPCAPSAKRVSTNSAKGIL